MSDSLDFGGSEESAFEVGEAYRTIKRKDAEIEQLKAQLGLEAEAKTQFRTAFRETREALENCAECIAVDMAKMGCCGEGDSGDHRADHQFPAGFRATRDARAVLARYAHLAGEGK